MSNDMIYWVIIGAGFAATAVLALVVMAKTGRLSVAFAVSLLADAVIFIGGSLWWNGLYTGVQRMFGLFGFWIAFVNIEVIVFFALFIMKKRQG
ncbi:hypothetical protein [Paenibacillus hamazuiensis]|uniref:hypothetical protein n=1 Tax=Paenibacillus hamazuiensis TaxID=2936508 RepID=UPI00200D10AE|nr:hypothetical protein [Paenibacillus hamazuiensis]